MTPSVSELHPLALDIALFLGACNLLLVDLALPAGKKRLLGSAALVILLGVFVASFFVDTHGTAFGGAYVGGLWPLYWKRIALAAASLATLGALDHVDRHFGERQGEFYLLLLFSVTGMMVLPGARELITLVVCFELMGIPLSILAAYAKTDDLRGVHAHAAEAGLKLYLISAVSTAITVYGLSLVYGMSGSTYLEAIGAAPDSPLLRLGMLLTLCGMAFKIGAVPFHMWIPDTYQGAPTPVVAFLSVAPKATGFAALSALAFIGFHAHAQLLSTTLLVWIVASITVGNLLALPQSDLKRLIGYSGVAQIGYMLLGLESGNAYGAGMLLFYLAGYVVSNIGILLICEAIASRRVGVTVADLDGLVRRTPWLGLSLLLFLLSLAGIPFAVGFWAKLLVFMAAYNAGHAGLVLFGTLMAIVALFYYLRMARAAFMQPPAHSEPVQLSAPMRTAIAVCLLGVVGMGVYPTPFINGAVRAADALFAELG